MGLSQLYAPPTTMLFGGAVVRAGELKIRDLAAIDAVAVENAPDPLRVLDHARTYLAVDPSGQSLRVALLDAYDEAEAWPPDPSRPGVVSEGWFDGLARLGELTFRCLDRGGSGLDRDRTDALLLSILPGQFDRLHRVAMALDPLPVLMSWVDPWSADRAAKQAVDDPDADWDAMIWSVMEDRSWTYDQVADLTIGQFRHAARRGKPADRGTEAIVPLGVGRVEFARNQRRIFNRELPPPDGWLDRVLDRLPAPPMPFPPDPERDGG